MIIKNGLIHDAINEQPYVADIEIENGKIVRIGQGLTSGKAIDAAGKDVYPGLVEAHCHMGVEGYGIGFERNDCNEYGDPITPHIRAIDGVNPLDPAFAKARLAGITTICTGPGSANVIGGQFVAMKTAGHRIDDMVIKAPAAMKCAFGENPKRCYKDKGNATRMTTAANLRAFLFKSREYLEKKKAANGDVTKMPAFDLKLESMIPVMNKEIPLKAHAHAADDIFTAIRIAKEFDVLLTIEHTTEGHLIWQDLVKENYPMAVGPTLNHATKFEVRDKNWMTPGVLAKHGGQVSIITDSPVIPQQYLPICAGMAIHAGMDPFKALQAITINPARHIGVSDRVGSIEVGKDADILIVEGSLFDVDHTVEVYIDGNKVEE